MEEYGDAIAAKLAEVRWRHGIVSMTIRARGLGRKRRRLRRLLRVEERRRERGLFLGPLWTQERGLLRRQERGPLREHER